MISCVYVNSTTVEDDWKVFMIKFKKSYKSSKEEITRFEIFKENLNFIENHNKNRSMTFQLLTNQYSDLNDSERSEGMKPLTR